MKAHEEVKATAAASEIVNDDRISSTQKTEPVSPVYRYTSWLRVTLKRRKKERKGEQKIGNGEIAPSSTTEMIKRSASEPLINRTQKKTRFHIVSLLTNIIYNKDREYQRKRKIDEKIATSGNETDTILPDIEKLHEYSSMDNFPRHAIARDITARNHAKNAFPGRPDLPKFSVDRQCQTASDAVNVDHRALMTLLRAIHFSR